MITLYDLAAKQPIKTWSLNVWKVRYILNLKNLPYKTIYLEFPEIAPTLHQANIPPIIKRDGNPGYIVPSIFDDTTKTGVSDSFKIAEYLDKQYPDTPKAFPLESITLQAAFYTQFNERIRSVVWLVVPHTPEILNPVSSEYYHCVQRTALGKPLVVPVGEELEQLWKEARDVFDWLDGLYSKSSGPYFMGDVPSFADFILGGVLEAMKILGDWENIRGLNGGRWERLVMNLEKYASTEN